MLFPPLVFAAILIACNCLTTFTIGATLAEDEVDALRSIANTLGKTNWNFDIDPCSGDENWTVPDNSFYANNVTCDCSFNNNTACHVVSIMLKGQDLPGTLPSQLDRLHFLQVIDLTRNYLIGNIPTEWGSMHLIRISLLGNRLTGSIPQELGNLSNLTDLVLEQNRLSGTLPKELGDLPNIERMFLNSNKFTGTLPETFARLTTLKGFRISDNNFTGQIPHFIQNWKKLEQLHMHASGLSGPIPSAIDALENITDLRISDLNGAEGPFPPLSNLTKLKRLTFRSCNLIGGLPDSLGELKKLKQLDLSFNRLSGEIPNKISAFGDQLDNFYLTGNLFTGQVPDWIVNTKEYVDVSYNNFTNTGVVGCQSGNANFFNSTERSNKSGTVSCLGIHQCQKPLNSLHINCGGTGVTVNHTTYDPDIDKAGPSTFVKGGSNWVLSNTGHFLDDNHIEDFLTLGNTSDPELYLTARLSPISLTYYAYCLENRTYSVNLHFAEIQFAEDKLFTDEETLVLPSFGRRIFDVYIQGKRELKDFNIKVEAGGPNKPIVKNFSITVTDGTLEIRLQWAGKGTTAIPERGVYGPLISAISVFDPGRLSIGRFFLSLIIANCLIVFQTLLF